VLLRAVNFTVGLLFFVFSANTGVPDALIFKIGFGGDDASMFDYQMERITGNY